MGDVDFILGTATSLFRRRPLMRRFREGMRVELTEDGFELRVDMGGLGFEWHGALRLPERWDPELTRVHIERFISELEQGFVDAYDTHLAKQEAVA